MEATKDLSSLNYDLKKVDKVNLILIWALLAITIIQDVLNEADGGISTIIQAVPVGILVTVIYFLKFNRFIKSLLFGLIPALVVCLVIFLDGFSLDKHYMLCVITVVIALYFDRKLLFVYGIFINAALIALYLISPSNLLGGKSGLMEFLSIFFLINGQIIALYFLTTWGKSILNNAVKNNSEAKTLLEQLQTAGVIDKKQSEFRNAELNKLMGNLENLSAGNLLCDIDHGTPDEDTRVVYELFQTIGNKLFDSVQTIKGYITEISDVLTQVSEGDLCVNITSEYKGDFAELKSSINNIITSVSSVLTEINTAAAQVASGTRQVSDGSQEISQGATEQSSAIEELTATVTQIAEQTKNNALSANQANELTLAAKEDAALGNKHMEAMQKAMAEINEASLNISKIIKVIDDIAFQTNILALNAAVEAARAGIHGKGFAVVAEEVRNLAARSANAAKETTDLIEGSIKKAEAGTKIADETAKALSNIVSGVDKAAQLVGKITAESNEQASAITQVNKGIEQMNAVVQLNSATSEETAASAEELSSQAELLKEMAGRFKLKTNEPRSANVRIERREYTERSNKPQIALNDNEFGKY